MAAITVAQFDGRNVGLVVSKSDVSLLSHLEHRDSAVNVRLVSMLVLLL